MSLKNVGENASQEFFETIIYHMAYDEVQKVLRDYTKDIDNPIIRDAVESALSVALFGAVFMVIQKQEKLIEWLFNLIEGAVAYLILNARGAFSKIKGQRGVKATRRLRFLNSRSSDDINTALVLSTHQGHKANAKSTENRSQLVAPIDRYKAYTDTKQNLYQREQLHMNMGNAMASRYNETLLFKLFTKSFTPNDTMLIKKILGRDTGAALNIDDLNQVADFLFVKDTNGKVTGLTEAFFQLVNTLGYVNK